VRLDQLKNATLAEVGEHVRALAARDARISELCDVLLKKAVFSRASDIHIEPHKNGSRIRYRIDGAFQHAAYLPIELHDQLVSRVKVLADLLSHRREIVQEGRITLDVGGERTDLRVSIVPTVGGEKVVARVFSVARAIFELTQIGYDDDMRRKIRGVVLDLEGLFLLTGPSGSGKTTTLYALLNEVYQELDAYTSIFTIEDPVEYQFGLWSQMQVNRQVGLDFAAGLKAALRQDPEVIMVGEIRDAETAETALRAGLTGHLVLSTLHSGSAPETITRLINMNLEPFVVASALTGTIAQRLVRRLCDKCREETELAPERADLIARLTKSVDASGAPAAPKGWRGKGCEQCSFTGYHGRLPIAELVDVDEDVRALVLEKARTSTIRQHLLERGWRTILDDGLQKAWLGQTTYDEILRNVSLREAM
jgi:type II secretory ATPase GspE/PulE/Tfp pilus assembly ATPase PilB-like protein